MSFDDVVQRVTRGGKVPADRPAAAFVIRSAEGGPSRAAAHLRPAPLTPDEARRLREQRASAA